MYIQIWYHYITFDKLNTEPSTTNELIRELKINCMSLIVSTTSSGSGGSIIRTRGGSCPYL